MTQAHDMLAATIAAMGALTFGAAAGLVAIGALMLARGDRPARPKRTPGVVATGFRFCSAELRTSAVVLHTDGTAVCLGCGHHIPAAREATGA